ncbi:MAG: ATP synthase F1 subunit gamma [Candidatus Nephrothrix sp. EaCA]|nr:MAG: ATP synthase F1 subunit gamma [Candidatus Nephrothrix sp. EaCA]
MASLKEVKNRIATVVSTQQITKAMKMVAASKLRRSQERVQTMRPYARKFSAMLQNVCASADEVQSVFSKAREENKILLVVVSSDRGLCGSFNSIVIKYAVRLMNEKFAAQHRAGNVTVLPIGKKAFEYFEKRKFNLIDSHYNIFHDFTFDNTSLIGDMLMEKFKSGEFDRIEIIYNEFKNVATQVLRHEDFLPIQMPKAEKQKTMNYIYQPNQETIVTGMIPKALKIQLYKALLDSNAAENGARMTAMDKATDNAGELLKDLRLTYNRTRQAAITKEILEIVAGAEALKSA